MASYYEHHYEIFGEEVLRSGFMRAEMIARAEAIMAEAIATAPVGNPSYGWYRDGQHHPGEYKESFSVSSGIGAYGGEGTRVYGRVTNSSDHARAVEYGIGRVPKHRTLFRALHVIGGDIHAGGGNP